MRLIDAKDCKELMYIKCAWQDKKFLEAMEDVIENTPTIDAVEVVRCYDCKYCGWDDIYDRYWCERTLGNILVQSDDYCSFGKRKEVAE